MVFKISVNWKLSSFFKIPSLTCLQFRFKHSKGKHAFLTYEKFSHKGPPKLRCHSLLWHPKEMSLSVRHFMRPSQTLALYRSCTYLLTYFWNIWNSKLKFWLCNSKRFLPSVPYALCVSVCLSDCHSVRAKTEKSLIRNWCNLIQIKYVLWQTLEVVRIWWYLT